MISINPYLNFDGNTKEAFEFYKSVFGGEFTMLQTMGEAPGTEMLSEEEKKGIMHVALPIGEGHVLMGSDIMKSMGHVLDVGNNLHISIQLDTESETTRIFNAISSGGKVTMPLDKTFWGAFFGMCVDKFGVQWMINCELK